MCPNHLVTLRHDSWPDRADILGQLDPAAYLSSGVLLRQRDVDSLLESSPDGGVQDPGDVGGAEDEDAVVVVADALHLDQKLGLDPSSRFALVVRPGRAEGVDFV